MRAIWTALATAALAAGLVACSEDRPTGAQLAEVQGSPAPAPAAKTGHGTGTVTAINAAAGTVTISHGPIPELGWPAMTMAFNASPPKLLTGIAVGDRVRFDLKLDGGGGDIVALARE
jgi:Cu/Ag efflux protein CusF